MSINPAYRPDIDTLRAIAVLAVLLFHLQVPGFGGGFVGVDVFFVISGYLITHNILSERATGTWRLSTFYLRRLRRLFPAAATVLVLALTLGFTFADPWMLQQTGDLAAATLMLIPNFALSGGRNYFAMPLELHPLLHMWSLGIEEQFYLLWPLLLLLLLRLNRRAALIVAVALGVATVALAEAQIAEDASAAFYLLPYRATGLAVGAALALWKAPRLVSATAESLVLTLGLLLIVGSVLVYEVAPRYPGLAVLPPVIGAALTIYAGRAPYLGRVMTWQPLVFIGLISYSLYLLNWPLVVFYKHLTQKALQPFDMLLLTAVSVFGAWLMYRWVETPFRKPASNSIEPAQNNPRFVLGCVVLAAAVGGLGIWTHQEKGFPGRMLEVPNKVARINEACLEPRRGPKGCIIGKQRKGPMDILVLGDSNALTYSGALGEFGKRHGLKLRTAIRFACPPLFDTLVMRRTPGGPLTNCIESMQAWQAFALERRPQAVMLIARWTHHAEPASGHAAVSRPVRLVMDRSDTFATLATSRAHLQRALPATVATLVAQGSKVIIVQQAPDPGINPKTCDRVPRWLGSEAYRSYLCEAAPLERVRARHAFVDGIVDDLASDQVLVLRPASLFCTPPGVAGGRCEYRQGAYKDATHLSGRGARMVLDHYREDILQFLDRAP